jgi:hypothetical protein
MVVEAMHTKTEEAMTKLLKHLFDTFVVSIDQMKVVRSASNVSSLNDSKRSFTFSGL